MKIAFLPIKPIYAERLVSGEKFFEYRRRPISPDVTHIIVYASSPLKKIIGIVEVRQVHSGAPSTTWVKTLHGAGITEQEFHSYFAGRTIAYAIEIKPKATIRLQHNLRPTDIEAGFKVPQSFMYVDESFLNSVISQGF